MVVLSLRTTAAHNPPGAGEFFTGSEFTPHILAPAVAALLAQCALCALLYRGTYCPHCRSAVGKPAGPTVVLHIGLLAPGAGRSTLLGTLLGFVLSKVRKRVHLVLCCVSPWPSLLVRVGGISTHHP